MPVEFGVDFAPLGKLGEIYQQSQQRQQLQEGLQKMGLPANMSLAQIALQQQEHQRQQANIDRAYKLQEKLGTEKPQVVWQDRDGVSTPFLVEPMGRGIRQLPVQGGAPPPAGAPVIPPGADPKTFRVGLAKEGLENKELLSGGNRVLGMVDQLEKKVGSVDPATGKFVGTKEFQESTGPFVSALHDQPVWSPGRIGYEMAQSRSNKTFLDTIKQDAQAINSQMQRELLKGGGAITEAEREQINQILGKISGARSPEEASKLLNNFRGLIRTMFKMDATAPTAAPTAAPGATKLPTIATPADAAKLPKGTRFLDPNGVERVVP